MPDSLSNPFPVWTLLFRRTPGDKFSPGDQQIEEADADAAKIRCPHCEWRPTYSSKWTCWDCDHPEYFYGGCGSRWNTFETEGLCPMCGHLWKWTACLRCGEWALHRDWYE